MDAAFAEAGEAAKRLLTCTDRATPGMHELQLAEASCMPMP